MSATDSLNTTAEAFKKLGGALSAASDCIKAVDGILTLKETVQKLCLDAEKVKLRDSDFQEYKRDLHNGVDILTTLEVPRNILKDMAVQLRSIFQQVIGEKRLTRRELTIMRVHLERMLASAKGAGKLVDEFQCAMELVRKHCTSALRRAEEEAKKLAKEISSERKSGYKGAGVAVLGTAAVVLGIVAIVSGGTGLVVAGVIGFAGGGAAAVKGGATVAKAALSVHELNKRASRFNDSVQQFELFKSSITSLEKNVSGVVNLTDAMLKGLHSGFEVLCKLETDAAENEQLKDENVTLKDENVTLKDKMKNLERQLAELRP